VATEGPIGLIAGSGRFPVAFARGAARHGLRVVCVGVAGEAPEPLLRHALAARRSHEHRGRQDGTP